MTIGGLEIPRERMKAELVFNDVHFSYPSRDAISILNGISLKIPSGKVTALVGGSGSGKSTLASLILRFYDPQQGCVTLDDVPITQLDPAFLRQTIGWVPQVRPVSII